MNNSPDGHDLLHDVLGEGAPGRFREALLGETLRLARRRRHVRRARSVIGGIALIAAAAILIRQSAIPPASHPIAETPAPVKPTLVTDQPLPPSAIITTQPFSGASLPGPLPLYSEVTTVAGNFRNINDDDLLAITAGRHALLIRTGPDSEKLVFEDPKDQHGFPAN